MDLTALGDVPNVAARLASMAEPGETVVSEAVISAANLEVDSSETQLRNLKGREQPVATSVLRVGPP